MAKLNLSINEIMNMINIGEPIPKSKHELLETICTLEPNYKNKVSQLVFLNINTLTYLVYTLIQTKYSNKYVSQTTNREQFIKEIVLTEDIVYY